MTKELNKVFYTRELGKIDINFSARFLLPCINLNSEKLISINKEKFNTGFQVLSYYGFKNLYLWDENIKTNKHSLLMLFNPSLHKLHKWHEFKNVYSKFSNYLGEYFIDSGVIVLEFMIIKSDYYPFKNYLIKGEYSKMNIGTYLNNFKKVIDNNKPYLTEEGLIINKSAKYREELEEKLKVKIDPNAELGSIPNIENEYLQLNYINI